MGSTMSIAIGSTQKITLLLSSKYQSPLTFVTLISSHYQWQTRLYQTNSVARPKLFISERLSSSIQAIGGCYATFTVTLWPASHRFQSATAFYSQLSCDNDNIPIY